MTIEATLTSVRPMCARCQREVDSLHTRRCVRSLRTFVEVRCHGSAESFWVTDEFVHGGGDLRVGEAFAARSLAGMHNQPIDRGVL